MKGGGCKHVSKHRSRVTERREDLERIRGHIVTEAELGRDRRSEFSRTAPMLTLCCACTG